MKTNSKTQDIRNSKTYELWKQQWHKPLESLYRYLPTKYKSEATERDWQVRRLVWDFKEGKRSIGVAQVVAQRLVKMFGAAVTDITLVCIPASSAEKNERRYKTFAAEVSRLTGCANGYEAVKVEGERLAIHEHRGSKRLQSTQVISFDKEYFAGRKVVIFDDILTLGHTYARFACALEALGATVIGGLFLGRTITL